LSTESTEPAVLGDVQDASGYEYTLVNGEVFMDHGEHTGVLSGVTLRY
jgi:hypothetical protein